MDRARARALSVTVVLSICACASIPVRAERADPRDVHREITANALTGGQVSDRSGWVLEDKLILRTMARLPTSIDNMTPGNPFIRALAGLPVAPGIRAHSIVAVDGDGPPELGGDGVVEYQSAHVDGVESELIVRSGHSAQDHPDVIEEIRRILLEHAETFLAKSAP